MIGRLVRDVETKYTQTGTGVAKFTLAVDREMSRQKKQEAESQGKQTADFINITVFGKQADNCSNYLAKGNQCAVHGRISTGSYTTKTGEKRYTTDVISDRVEFLGQAKKSNEDVFKPVTDDQEIPF